MNTTRLSCLKGILGGRVKTSFALSLMIVICSTVITRQVDSMARRPKDCVESSITLTSKNTYDVLTEPLHGRQYRLRTTNVAKKPDDVSIVVVNERPLDIKLNEPTRVSQLIGVEVEVTKLYPTTNHLVLLVRSCRTKKTREKDCDSSTLVTHGIPIANQGIHSQCMADTPFAWNYTDSPKSNWGKCTIRFKGVPLEVVQYIYKRDGSYLNQYDVLKECMIQFSCYEGIMGAYIMRFSVNPASSFDVTQEDLVIKIDLYKNRDWEYENEMGNLDNAQKILEFHGVPVDSSVLSTTKSYVVTVTKFIRENCTK